MSGPVAVLVMENDDAVIATGDTSDPQAVAVAGVDAGRAHERGAILMWLRSMVPQGVSLEYPSAQAWTKGVARMAVLSDIADAIERGAHQRTR